MRKLVAECFGTFCLVFAGTGAIVVNEATGGAVVTHVGVSLVFGLIVAAMIYALGDVSGCHLNPAVTIGFAAARRFELRSVAPYIGSQLAGAPLASITLRILFPDHATLGATLPAGSDAQSFVLEFVLTLILMFVILSVSSGAKEQGSSTVPKRILAGVAIGAVVAVEALFAGPICGASMNPARSFAPAMVSLRPEHLWIYLLAPVLGAMASVLLCRIIQPPHCCGGESCS